MEDRTHVLIGELKVPVVQFKLREWLRLEEIRSAILDAVEAKNGEQLVSLIYFYVSTASSFSEDDLKKCPWYEVAEAYSAFHIANTPKLDLPFLRTLPKKPSMMKEKFGWEYYGRMWYSVANTLCRAYGWTLDYVAGMSVDDGLALLQEITVDDQLQREWEWSLTEFAYSYNEHTKQSKFIPLKRPEWMEAHKEMKEIPNVRIKKNEVPVGIVLRWDNGKTEQPQ